MKKKKGEKDRERETTRRRKEIKERNIPRQNGRKRLEGGGDETRKRRSKNREA